MSDEATIYGAIMLWRFDAARGKAYSHNRDVISTLPELATYPESLMTKGMFTAPLEQNGVGFYRNQIIHFGASYNHLSEFWHNWLDQFEILLHRVMWCETHLHMKMLIADDYFHWKAVGFWNEIDADQGVKQWTFTGGERSYRRLYETGVV